MEWKIGEIKQVNGEWYQCVEGENCEKCVFDKKKCCTSIIDDTIGHCEDSERKDNKNVIFKKLKKVGVPFEYHGKLYQRYKLPMEIEVKSLPNNCYPVSKRSLSKFENKQNEKDKEEKKQYGDACSDNRFKVIEEAKIIC